MRFNPRMMKKLLKKTDPLILELGAHKGADTRKILKEFKSATLYCFEPHPDCVKEFRKKIRDRRCVLIEAAVSNKDGRAFLNLSSGVPPWQIPVFFRCVNLAKRYMAYRRRSGKMWDYSSSIKESISHPEGFEWLYFDKKIEVETVKLDSWAQENKINAIDFIWSDIQGAEKDMIEGGVNALNMCKYLLIEYGEKATYPEAMNKEETAEALLRFNFEIIQDFPIIEETGSLLMGNRKLT